MKMSVVVIAAIVVIVGIVLGAGIWMQHSRSYAKRAQNLFSYLQTGQYQRFEAEFNLASRNGKIPKLLADEWTRLIAEFGPFKKCTVLRTELVKDSTRNLHNVYLICEFEKGKRYVYITYDTTNTISRFSMGESEH